MAVHSSQCTGIQYGDGRGGSPAELLVCPPSLKNAVHRLPFVAAFFKMLPLQNALRRAGACTRGRSGCVLEARTANALVCPMHVQLMVADACIDL